MKLQTLSCAVGINNIVCRQAVGRMDPERSDTDTDPDPTFYIDADSNSTY